MPNTTTTSNAFVDLLQHARVATKGHSMFRFEYGGGREPRAVFPVSLVAEGNPSHFVLRGFDPARGGYRAFRLDRMSTERGSYGIVDLPEAEQEAPPEPKAVAFFNVYLTGSEPWAVEHSTAEAAVTGTCDDNGRLAEDLVSIVVRFDNGKDAHVSGGLLRLMPLEGRIRLLTDTRCPA